MLHNTDFFIAMRCPECGRQMLYRCISLFSLQAEREWSIECSCGCSPCRVEMTRGRELVINVLGPCCDEAHEFVYNLRELQYGQVYSLRCDTENLHLGYVGMRNAVLNALCAEGMLLVECAAELQDYFDRPEIMGYVLDGINRLYGEGLVRCTCCSSDSLNLDIKTDSIEIRCGECHSGGILAAATSTDKLAISLAREILLTENGARLELPPPDKKAQKQTHNTK